MSELDEDMLEVGKGGLLRASMRNQHGDRAHVYVQGAHITDFQPRDQKSVLFVSKESRFEPGKPIRGGVPIVFPWFGPHPTDKSKPQHGFARTAKWDGFAVASTPTGAVGLRMRLGSSDQTLAWLPSGIQLLYEVVVGSELSLVLTVTNGSHSSFSFEEALHTYLSVADVRNITIEGLAGRTFIDKVDGGRKVQSAGPMTISGETDRVYLDTPDVVSVNDSDLRRRLVVSKSQSASTVVWNPWIEKARAMSDFGDDEWLRMLCIETANVADNRITLAPGASHAMRATISVEPL